jgi:uncharacterized protein (TIGR02246 family)
MARRATRSRSGVDDPLRAQEMKMHAATEAISQNTEQSSFGLPRTRPASRRANGGLATVLVGAVTLVLLALVPATVFAGPAEEASAVIDRWEAAYSANDSEAVANLYAPEAILFGTRSPMIFDGAEPVRAAFAHLAANDNKVRISHRRTLVLFDDRVLVTGSYEFKSIGRLAPSPILAGFTMLVVKRDGHWRISYHTSFPPPVIDPEHTATADR